MKLSLNGVWECRFPDGRVKEIQVPGCWDTYVEEKNIADCVRYRKTFHLEHLTEGCFRLCFRAVSYYCDVWLNGEKIGSHEGMWDSFSFMTGTALREGENVLILDIWKPGYSEEDRFPLREVLSGFIPDVLCTFGGIWDDVWLESSEGLFVDGHWADGDEDGNVTVSIRLAYPGESMLHAEGSILNAEGKCVALINQKIKENTLIALQSAVSGPKLWGLGDPALYTYELVLDNGRESSKIHGTFGFRKISADRTRILLNGEPVYPRGILHWGYYESIAPVPDREKIQEEIDRIKSYGFNMIKHCLYIPRKDYLTLADAAGMMLWIELPLWLPEKTPELEKRIRREFPRLMEQIAGHPSVVMVSLGCELDSKVDSDVLEEMYLLAKEKLNILVRDNSGSGECYGGLSVDFADFSDYHFYGELQNMENLMEMFTPEWKKNRPWVYGEFCDSDTLRDLEPLRKEAGVERFFWELQDEEKNPICTLKPDFFLGEHDERMEKSGIRREFSVLRRLSYDHSMVHRKTTIEQTRSFQTIGGYNITSIRDVPIATSGIFDDFMRDKFDRERFRSFNQDVVILPAWDLSRIWISADRVMPKERYGFFGGEYYGLHILVSNYSGKEICDPEIIYELCSTDGTVEICGRMDGEPVGKGKVSETGYLYFQLPETRRPENYTLKVKLRYDETETANEWPVFLYPQPKISDLKAGLFDPMHVFDGAEELYSNIAESDGRTGLEAFEIMFTSMLTPEILDYTEKGGAVFYVQRGKGGLPSVPAAFWREGMVRRFGHPLLDELERGSWMDDLRYFGSTPDTAFSDVDDPRFDYRKPVLRRYDCREWRADDYIVELGCGKGKIIATTLRIEGGMGKQPVGLKNNRFARWMLDKAAEYLLKADRKRL